MAPTSQSTQKSAISWHRPIPAILLGLGLILSVAAFQAIRSVEDKRVRDVLVTETLDHVAALDQEINITLESLHSIGGLFNASEQVEEEEFRTFTRPILERNPQIHAVQWLPNATSPGIPIHVMATVDDSSQWVTAIPTRILDATLAAARDRRDVAVSEPVRADQSRSTAAGVLFALPVYGSPSSADHGTRDQRPLRGFVVATVRIDELVSRSIDSLPTAERPAIRISNVERGDARDVVYGTHGIEFRESTPRSRSCSQILPFLNRIWLVEYMAEPGHARSAYAGWYAYAILISGVLLSVFASGYVRHLLIQHGAVARVVEEKTEKLDRFFTLSLDMFCIAGTDGYFKQLNPAFTRTLGHEIDHMLSTPFLEFVHPEDREATTREVEQLARGIPTVNFENRYRHQDGSYRWFQWNAASVTDAGIIYAAARDVTELREHDQRLTEAASRMKAILNTAADGIITIDQHGIIESVNPAAEAMFGFSAEEMIGENVKILMPSPDRERHDAYLTEYLQHGGSGAIGTTREVIGQRKDGSAFPLELATSEIQLDDERLFTGILRDITRRKEAEAQLVRAKGEAEKANQAKSEFLAAMSHELRTPLNGVIGMIELLRDTDLEPRQRRFVDACRDSAHSLLQIINDVLDISKIEAGRLELDSHEFPLVQTVDDSIALMAHRAHEKGLELGYFVVPEVRTSVIGDSTRLRQVIVNLLSNAIKFTEEGQVVLRLVLEAEDAEELTIRLSVSDTGIGIPTDRRNRLFRTFSQIDPSTARKYGGTGLGLSICKNLVEAMGGAIGVESEIGRGSTFWFTVRLRKTAPGEAQVHRIPPDLKELRVLVAGDNETGRLIFTETFEGWGIPAEHVALSDLDLGSLSNSISGRTGYDLLVIDMPLLNPRRTELSRQLAEVVDRLPMPVFVLLPRSGDCDFSCTRPIDRCFRKPPTSSELLDALTDVFCGAPVAANVDEDGPSPQTRGSGSHSRSQSTEGTILLAEDNETGRLYVRELLSRAGYQCKAVTTGGEAVEAVRNEAFDLILMDCQMPEMDGLEATRAIRRLQEQGAVPGGLPIIALTANAIAGDRESCLSAGMDDYVSKPVEPDSLLAVIRDHLAVSAKSSPPEAPEVQAQSGGAPPALDPQAALARCMGDHDLLAQMLDSFGTETAALIKRLEGNLERRDADGIRRAAHSVKGAAGMITAAKLSSLAADVEALARESRIDPIFRKMELLREEFDRCRAFIEQFGQSGTARQPGGVSAGEGTDAGADRR